MKIDRVLTGIVLTAALAMSAGCIETTDGELGNLSFQDETSGLEDTTDRRLDRAVAVGATLPVTARCDDGSTAALVAANSSDETIATVRIDVTAAGDSLVLVDALAAGEVSIDVQSRCGDDRFTITTAEATSAQLRWAPFASIVAPASSLWADGVALLPDAPIDVRARRFDADGGEMTGFGGLDWAVVSDTDDLATVTSRTVERMGDTVTLRSGPDAGAGTLDAGLGETLEIRVITADDIARLGLADIATEAVVEAGGAIEVPAHRELYILHLAAWTADGAWIAGAGDEITMSVLEGDDTLISTWDGAGLFEEEADQAELERIIQNGRALVWTTSEPGALTLEIRWAGQTATFEVTIVDDEADAEADASPGLDGEE